MDYYFDGECRLFDGWPFRGFLTDGLNFQPNGRELWPNGIK
jgi:hypothetical protein